MSSEHYKLGYLNINKKKFVKITNLPFQAFKLNDFGALNINITIVPCALSGSFTCIKAIAVLI